MFCFFSGKRSIIKSTQLWNIKNTHCWYDHPTRTFRSRGTRSRDYVLFSLCTTFLLFQRKVSHNKTLIIAKSAWNCGVTNICFPMFKVRWKVQWARQLRINAWEATLAFWINSENLWTRFSLSPFGGRFDFHFHPFTTFTPSQPRTTQHQTKTLSIYHKQQDIRQTSSSSTSLLLAIQYKILLLLFLWLSSSCLFLSFTHPYALLSSLWVRVECLFSPLFFLSSDLSYVLQLQTWVCFQFVFSWQCKFGLWASYFRSLGTTFPELVIPHAFSPTKCIIGGRFFFFLGVVDLSRSQLTISGYVKKAVTNHHLLFILQLFL